MFKGRNSERIVRSSSHVRDCSCMLTVSNVRVGNVVESMYREVTKSPHCSDPSVHYGNDIALILNQKRLDRMSLQGFSDYLNQAQVGDDPLKNIRSRMSDDQLLKFIKSRYIQSASELKSWYSYLHSTICNEINSYNQSVIDKAAELNAQAAAASPAPAAASSE